MKVQKEQRKTGAEGRFFALYGAVVESLLRSRRACSLSVLLLVQELVQDGELSTLAVVRRLRRRGVKNPRMVLCRARGCGYVTARVCADGDVWVLTQEGWAAWRRTLESVWRMMQKESEDTTL